MVRSAALGVLILLAGGLAAAILGSAAGRALALERDALGPIGGARIYVSGPRLVDEADGGSAPGSGRAAVDAQRGT